MGVQTNTTLWKSVFLTFISKFRYLERTQSSLYKNVLLSILDTPFLRKFDLDHFCVMRCHSKISAVKAMSRKQETIFYGHTCILGQKNITNRRTTCCKGFLMGFFYMRFCLVQHSEMVNKQSYLRNKSCFYKNFDCFQSNIYWYP